jgi:hypothetical protein
MFTFAISVITLVPLGLLAWDVTRALGRADSV